MYGSRKIKEIKVAAKLTSLFSQLYTSPGTSYGAKTTRPAFYFHKGICFLREKRRDFVIAASFVVYSNINLLFPVSSITHLGVRPDGTRTSDIRALNTSLVASSYFFLKTLVFSLSIFPRSEATQ